jgi:hypothetical protein
VSTETSIYVFGGIDVDGRDDNDLFVMDVRSMEWKRLEVQGLQPQWRSGGKAIYLQ